MTPTSSSALQVTGMFYVLKWWFLSVSLSVKWGAYSDIVTSMPLCPLPHCFLQPLLALPVMIQPPPLLPPGAPTANGPAHILGERQTPTWHVEYLCKVKLWVTAKQTHTTRMSMLINFRVLLTKNQTITFVINGSFFLAAITPNSGNRLVNNKSAQNIEQEILNKSAPWVFFTISGSNRKRQSWPKDPSKKVIRMIPGEVMVCDMHRGAFIQVQELLPLPEIIFFQETW